MGTTIRGKTQVASPVGTEAFPVSTATPGDGWMTLDQIVAAGFHVYNVKKYGAVGNGSHDDTTNIQAAIDAAGTAGGGIVFLPAATYLISASLLLNKSGVALVGAGIGATFIVTNTFLAGDSTFDAVVVQPTTTPSYSGGLPNLGQFLLGCSVRDLTIDHVRATTNVSCGLKMIFNTFMLIQDVEVLNFGGGIYCGASLLTMYERMRVSVTNKGNVNPMMYGIRISSAEGTADTMRFHNCGVLSGFQSGGGGPGTMNSSHANTLAGGINSSQTSIGVNSSFGTFVNPFSITIDTEVMQVTNITGGTTLTVTRAFAGSTAASHSNAATVGYVSYVGWYLGGGNGCQDVMISDCESDNGDICLLIDGTNNVGGVGGFDVHFYNFACDYTGGQTVVVQNVQGSYSGAIDFDGGICDNGIGYQIINSSGVTVRGVQFLNTSTASVGFSGACTDCSVTSSTSRGPQGDHIVVSGASKWIAIGNNNFITTAANTNARGVWFTGSSTDSTVTGNTIHGSAAGKSVLIDSGCARIAVVANAGGGSSNFVDTPAVNSLANNV